jgi:hypothetical protein
MLENSKRSEENLIEDVPSTSTANVPSTQEPLKPLSKQPTKKVYTRSQFKEKMNVK